MPEIPELIVKTIDPVSPKTAFDSGLSLTGFSRLRCSLIDRLLLS
jgi:hypothetical protein